MPPKSGSNDLTSYGLGRTSCLYFLDSTIMVHTCGNAVRIVDVTTNQERFVWGEAWGISCLAVSGATRLLAFAEKELKPKIHLYEVKSARACTLLHTLHDAAELEVMSLAFSGDGTQLVSLGSLPDRDLIVWDCTTTQIVCRGKTHEPMTRLSVCPFNPKV